MRNDELELISQEYHGRSMNTRFLPLLSTKFNN